MNKEKIKAEVRRIVALQFDRVTALSQEAHNDSLETIAEQIYALINSSKAMK